MIAKIPRRSKLKPKKTRFVGIKMTAKQKDALTREAKRQDVSVGKFVRLLIDNALGSGKSVRSGQ